MWKTIRYIIQKFKIKNSFYAFHILGVCVFVFIYLFYFWKESCDSDSRQLQQNNRLVTNQLAAFNQPPKSRNICRAIFNFLAKKNKTKVFEKYTNHYFQKIMLCIWFQTFGCQTQILELENSRKFYKILGNLRNSGKSKKILENPKKLQEIFSWQHTRTPFWVIFKSYIISRERQM